MAQKINPTSYRLGNSLDWPLKNIVFDQKDESYFISEQELITNLISKMSKKKKMFTSDIILWRTENQIQIKFVYYYYGKKKRHKKYPILSMKYLLEKIFLTPVYFKVERATSPTKNSKILNEYLKNFIKKNPRKYKTILKRILQEHNN